MSAKQIQAKIKGNLNTMSVFNASIYRTQKEKVDKMYYFAHINHVLSEQLKEVSNGN